MTVDWYEVLRWSSIVLLWAGIAINVLTLRRSRRTNDAVHDTATVALELLEQVEESRDPGRDAHDRLARAFEARLVLADHREDAKPDPAVRRAAAQAYAATVIEDIRRANLALVDAEPDPEVHP